MTMPIASLENRVDTGVVDGTPGPAARPRRRTFTAEYKARILDEYDALPAGSEQRGALLRREGLYSSHIAEWRKARDIGAREGLAPKAKQPRRTPEQVELDRLRRRNDRLEAELQHTKLALEITGKAHALGNALRERGLKDHVEAVIDEHLPDLEAATSTKRACALSPRRSSDARCPAPPATCAPSAPRPPSPPGYTYGCSASLAIVPSA